MKVQDPNKEMSEELGFQETNVGPDVLREFMMKPEWIILKTHLLPHQVLPTAKAIVYCRMHEFNDTLKFVTEWLLAMRSLNRLSSQELTTILAGVNNAADEVIANQSVPTRYQKRGRML